MMKRLLCKLLGHKDYFVLGGCLCSRCGRAHGTLRFFTDETLQVLRHSLQFTPKCGK